MNQFQRVSVVVALVAGISACGSVPVPKASSSGKGSVPPSAATTTAPAPATATTVAPAPAAAPEPVVANLTPKEHVQNAITFLQTGDEGGAKAELAAALKQEHDNKIARNLMSQIEADPKTFFGTTESFPYTVQHGESLSILARRFFDDPLKFHILAKYNDISDPSRLNPGQTIRIPGKKPVEVATAEETRYQQAKRNYDAARYSEAIEILEGGGTENVEGRDLLVLAYTKFADDLAQKAKLLEAQNVLEKAVVIQPNNEKLKKQLKQVETRREAARLFQAGTDALAAGDRTKAADLFGQVLKLDPGNDEAKKQMVSLKGDAVEALHKEALAEYNKQNLDKAIALWDSVLTMEPTHERAKLYRARAIELKEKLQKLEKK